MDPLINSYFGWGVHRDPANPYNLLWEPKRLLEIQSVITNLLEGVADRPIVVPLDTISNVLSECYRNNRPYMDGDIYSTYIQDRGEQRDDIIRLIDEAVGLIVSHVKTDYGTRQKNMTLSAWNTVYGDLGRTGLRRHEKINLRKRRPTPMLFHMRY